MRRTAECVSPKHPDKVCDRVSDAILEECLRQDKDSRVAVETLGGHGLIVVSGEITSNADMNIESIAKRVVGEDTPILVNIVKQSNFIAQGVDIGGAGDQGIMVGYACDENEEMIPQELYLARDLCRVIYEEFPEDGKTQISLVDGEIETVVASFCNVKTKTLQYRIKAWLREKAPKFRGRIFANPAGQWSQGGFDADVGVTGRKLVVDNYGPRVPIGGGAFSGKDPSKVDRSGAYMARRIAVDLLRKHNAKEVYVYIAYAIGVAEPVQVVARIDGVEEEVLGYDCSPLKVIDSLELRSQHYERLAEWGSFGHRFRWDI